MNSLIAIKNIIQKSQVIYIIPKKQVQEDVLGAGLALYYTLKKMNKNVNLCLEEIPEKFQFLFPTFSSSPPVLFRPQDFVISIDKQNTEISQIRYEKTNENLNLYLTPSNGFIEEENIIFSAENPKPDLLITLGITNLEDLEKIFKENPLALNESTILNIDNQIANENFGEINFIKNSNVSLAETVTTILKSLDVDNLFDKNTASWLLNGVIWASQNFQNQMTSSDTLKTASYLTEKGAEHQKIIHHFHKSKPTSYLKLLGQILKKINFNSEKEFAWACLTVQDFKESNSSPLDLSLVIKELKSGIFKLPTLLILWEESISPVLVKGIFYSDNIETTKKILTKFEGISRGQGLLFLIRDSTLASAEKKVLQIINF